MAPKKAVAATIPKVKDVHVMVALGLSGRTPIDGDIMSMSFVAFAPHSKTLLSLFHRNLLPQHPKPFTSVDVVGFWGTKPDAVELMMEDRVPLSQAVTELLQWVKPYGKVTLVGSPLMSMYGFLAEAMQTHAPGTAIPWGFSGVCSKSFASGVLGVQMKDLGKDPIFNAWNEGHQATAFSAHDAIVASINYCHAVNHTKDTPPEVAVADGAAAGALTLTPVLWAMERPSWFGVPSTLRPELTAVAPTFDFVEYPKMVDTDIHGDAVIPEGARGGEWVATEKVHGANLSVWTDGACLRVAKRTGFVPATDGKAFFGFDRVVSKLADSFLALHDAVKSQSEALVGVASEKVAAVVIFGELAGGEYNHPAVAKDLRGRRVQVGVQYAPVNFFYGFDLAVSSRDGSPLRFVSFDAATAIFAATSPTILRATVLHRGSFADLMAMDVAMQSTIPARLNLPQLSTPNFAEGLVIRPAARETVTEQGARVILKRKHALFKEFASAGAKDLPAAELVFSLMNRARVASVASKYTATELADLAAFRGYVVQDALHDAAAILAQRGEAFDGPSFAASHRLALEQAFLIAAADM